MVYEIKNPDAPATKKQTWTIFKLGGGDVRNDDLTRQQASDIIGDLWQKKNDSQPAKEDFQDLYDRALAAGFEAGKNAIPTPMIVTEHENMFDDNSPAKNQWYVSEGACGFGWVNVKPGTSRFARWLKEKDYANKDSYYGGVTIWIGEYNQSYERKVAHASAMAKVFTEAGWNAYGTGRLD